MQLGEEPLGVLCVCPSVRLPVSLCFCLSVFSLSASPAASLAVLLWRDSLKGSCVCGSPGSWGEMLAHIPSEEGLLLQERESAEEFPKWSGLHSLPSQLHLQKLLESVWFCRDLRTIHRPLSSLSAHPSGCNGIQPEDCSKGRLYYKQSQRQNMHQACRSRDCSSLIMRCNSSSRLFVLCAVIVSASGLLGYTMDVELIWLRHTRVSPLPLFIFTRPGICISHKRPRRVMRSEAEVNNACWSLGVSAGGVYYCTVTFESVQQSNYFGVSAPCLPW